MLRTALLYLSCILVSGLAAQSEPAPGDAPYGNEWIEAKGTYVKIKVAETGIYRLSPERLRAAGIDFSSGRSYSLVALGERIPIIVDADGITFYGKHNDGTLDKQLYERVAEQQLNDRYSMYTDTAAYFLSESPGGAVYTPSTVAGSGASLSSITRTSEVIFGEHFSKKFFRSGGYSIQYSIYDTAEGFGLRSNNDLLSSNGTTETAFTLPLPGAAGGPAVLDIRFGLGFEQHEQDILIDGVSVGGHTSNDWGVEQLSLPFTSGGGAAEIKLVGSGSDRDKANVAWAKVTYPARPSLADLRSFIAPAAAQNNILELTVDGADAGAVKLVNPATGAMVTGERTGGQVRFVLPSSEGPTEYHVVSDATVLEPAGLSLADLTTNIAEGSRVNYLILTSERLEGAELKAMADYRASPAGGGYVVQTVAVEDLYDEFAYGVDRHPVAIRNFVAAARESHPNLQYLFLVGKGREFPDVRTGEDLATARNTFFVPSFGLPASDNLLTAPINGIVPALSTGRLAAINGAEIGIYLDKLREVEAQVDRGDQSLADRDWMKQVLHLGGGTSVGEQTAIRNNLNRLEATVENSEWGGNVTSFFKTSTDPIETSQQKAIFNRINAGLSIITFHGHSSSDGFEFNIDEPANYNNTGKYPYMLSLGCYSGDAFVAGRSVSERFIFLPEKGAIAFAASKGVGFISALRTWGDKLYELTAGELYGQGIGDVMRANIAAFSSNRARSIRILTHQFALSGDPAFRLHPRPGPDVVVDPTTVTFEPEVIPAQDPNFDVSFRVVNIGKGGGQDSITVQFRQELPSGEVVEAGTHRMMAPNYDELVTVTLDNVGLSAVGQNRILIGLDLDNELTELPAPAAENNNDLVAGGQAGVPVTFIANTARTAFPPEYSVVGGGEIELISSTTDALAPERDYLLQVSDRRDFASLLIDDVVNSPGGIIRYTPDLPRTDSTTYYWRISPDSTFTQGAGYIWDESSFTYVTDTDRTTAFWAQQAPGQIVNGTFENIIGDSIQPDWRFAQTATDMRIFNAVYQSAEMPRFMRNSTRIASLHSWRTVPALAVLVIDTTNTVTSTGWLRNPGDGEYGTRVGRTSSWNFNTSSAAGRAGLIRFLDEAVPDGWYVYIYSLQRGANVDYYNDGWLTDEATLGTTLFDVFEEQGSLEIRSLINTGSVPYAFAFQKNQGILGEVIAESIQDTILLETVARSNWTSGSWTSEEAGPARQWTSVDVIADPTTLNANDSTIVELWGRNTNGEVTMLRAVPHRFENEPRLTLPLTDVNPAAYPTLFVTCRLFDDIDRTVGTIKGVYFNYEGYGDVAVNPQLLLERPDSILQGEPLTFAVGYENISNTDMDSLLVELRVIDRRNQVMQPP